MYNRQTVLGGTGAGWGIHTSNNDPRARTNEIKINIFMYEDHQNIYITIQKTQNTTSQYLKLTMCVTPGVTFNPQGSPRAFDPR